MVKVKNNTFNKFPHIKIIGMDDQIFSTWENILHEIDQKAKQIKKDKKILAFEFYQGIDETEVIKQILFYFKEAEFIFSSAFIKKSYDINNMIADELTTDPVFGRITKFTLIDFFESEKIESIKKALEKIEKKLIIVLGVGASLICDYDVLIYLDMARWEIIQRFRNNEVNNLFIKNKYSSFEEKYKRAYFIDWRLCDSHKKSLYDRMDFVIDTNNKNFPKMISGIAFREAITQTVNQPFSLVPFFDPGPWGGQWMKEVCDLDRVTKNFAWCFNCVPEENSILFEFGDILFESPAINIVFFKPTELLGKKIYNKFGAEFPIRFDFLDTFDGGNLSLQVHPTTDYIQKNFNMQYTQDESYYIFDSKPGAIVYLGLKEDCDKELMIKKLKESYEEGISFPVENFVEHWKVKKHDHFLIPAGTIHCSGVNSLVLEISSTPYIFTFKLWDWNRLGLNGQPRPIHLNHGLNVIQWDRKSNWVKNNLVNQITKIYENEKILEEKTGLHEMEIIETRRHWFCDKVLHETNGTVNVLNLVEGKQVLVESPDNSFEPIVINYAETFIIPANIDKYTISPYGKSLNEKCATIKAYIREDIY